MSNGIPEPFEERSRQPLHPLSIVAGSYTVLWGATAIASLFVDLPLLALNKSGWPFFVSLVVLAASLIVLAMASGSVRRASWEEAWMLVLFTILVVAAVLAGVILFVAVISS